MFSKILGIFLDPYVLALLLLAGAILTRRWRLRPAIAAFLPLAALGCGIVSDALAGSLERQYPEGGNAALSDAPAIVVLGGAIRGASAAFHKAGFEVIPAPADFQAGWYQGPMGWIPDAGSLIDSAKAIRERVGL